MTLLVLPKGSLATLAGTTLTEHGRQPISISFEEVGRTQRTANATMRRYFIAAKKKISISWDNIPALDSQCFDGMAGRNTIKALYDNNKSTLTFTYKEVDGSNVQSVQTLTVFVESYSEDLVKRWNTQLWKISLALVEQ